MRTLYLDPPYFCRVVPLLVLVEVGNGYFRKMGMFGSEIISGITSNSSLNGNFPMSMKLLLNRNLLLQMVGPANRKQI